MLVGRLRILAPADTVAHPAERIDQPRQLDRLRPRPARTHRTPGRIPDQVHGAPAGACAAAADLHLLVRPVRIDERRLRRRRPRRQIDGHVAAVVLLDDGIRQVRIRLAVLRSPALLPVPVRIDPPELRPRLLARQAHRVAAPLVVLAQRVAHRGVRTLASRDRAPVLGRHRTALLNRNPLREIDANRAPLVRHLDPDLRLPLRSLTLRRPVIQSLRVAPAAARRHRRGARARPFRTAPRTRRGLVAVRASRAGDTAQRPQQRGAIPAQLHVAIRRQRRTRQVELRRQARPVDRRLPVRARNAVRHRLADTPPVHLHQARETPKREVHRHIRRRALHGDDLEIDRNRLPARKRRQLPRPRRHRNRVPHSHRRIRVLRRRRAAQSRRGERHRQPGPHGPSPNPSFPVVNPRPPGPRAGRTNPAPGGSSPASLAKASLSEPGSPSAPEPRP